MSLTVSSKKSQFVQQGDTHDSSLQKKKVSSLSPLTKKWLKRDAEVFLHQALSTPVMNVMQSAKGAYISDIDGNRYLDLHGNGVHNIGFNHDHVIEAVINQLQSQLSFTPRRYTSKICVEFAEKLIGLAPEELNRLLFCPGGSEAIEMAVMLAKHVTGKWKTLSFWNQYHGNTFQSATLSGNTHFTTGMGPMVPGAIHIEYPNYYRNPLGLDAGQTSMIDDYYLHQARTAFKNNPDIACLLGTTISSTPSIPSKYFWSEMAAMCKEHGAFLIFDEIVCGLGRTGKLFACEHYVTPDVLVLGKSLGGSILPFAGILTKEEYNTVSEYSIGHFTHEKSPICSAVGKAMLEVMEEEGLVANAERMGNYLLSGFKALQEKFEEIGNVNGKGLLISLDIVKSRITKERDEEKANSILGFCLQNGLSFKVIDGNVLTLRPALTINQSQADFILEVFSKAFDQL